MSNSPPYGSPEVEEARRTKIDDIVDDGVRHDPFTSKFSISNKDHQRYVEPAYISNPPSSESQAMMALVSETLRVASWGVMKFQE